MYTLGALPSPIDERDYKYPMVLKRAELPTTLDLRKALTAIRDQGQQGTCVAQAGACCKEYQERRELNYKGYMSPQFIYNWRINYPSSGMYGRDLMEILTNRGVCREKYFPYGSTEIQQKIPDIAKQDGLAFKIKSYAQIQFHYSANGTPDYSYNIQAVKTALVENGPCVIILPCYTYESNFWIAKTPGDKRIGYHAVAVCGYDASGFLIRNSWGSDWGDRGYTNMSYSDYNKRIHTEIWTMVDDVSNITIEDDTKQNTCSCFGKH